MIDFDDFFARINDTELELFSDTFKAAIKTRLFEGVAEQETLTDFYYGFKRQQGYSDMEIAQKRDALDNVLIPDTLGTHRTRLHQAGFSHVTPWFQCFNFMSLLAHK